MKNKILIVCTNQDQYEKTKEPTGLWFSELIHFYDVFEKDNIGMEIASIQGGSVPIDPGSTTERMMDKVVASYFENSSFMQILRHSKKLSDLNAEDYDAIYFTGGHGTMWDFPESKALIDMAEAIYRDGGVVSAVCHGVGALLNLKDVDGSYLIDHKVVTGYSTSEEHLVKAQDKIPFLLEEELVKRGAKYKKALLPFTSYAKEDGSIITGQNPQSTSEVAHLLKKKIYL